MTQEPNRAGEGPALEKLAERLRWNLEMRDPAFAEMIDWAAASEEERELYRQSVADLLLHGRLVMEALAEMGATPTTPQ